MKVWISGAGGMIGSHLAEMLAAEGHEILATFYNPTIDLDEIAHLPTQEVDVTDWTSVLRSLADFAPNAIFHLAAQSYPTVSWQRPVETLRANVIGTAIVFEAVRALGLAPRIVVAGSSAAYGFVEPDEVPILESHALKPLHPYGVSKAATEMLAYQYWANFQVHALSARIFNCTGPRKVGDAASDFVRRAVSLENGRSDAVLLVGNLSAKRALIDVRDLNRALILLLDRGAPGEIYNVSGSTAYAMSQIVDLVLAQCARKDLAVEVDPELLRTTDEKIIWGDTRRLHDATGWRQEIPIERTIADMFTYWRGKKRSFA